MVRVRRDRIVGGRLAGVERDRGANPVELAVLMPAILILLLASIQAAAWFIARATALNAAQSAVSAQRAYQAEPGVGQQRAEDFLERAGDWLAGWEVTVTAVEPDDTQVSATVTGEPLRVVPLISLPPISETAFGTVERFTDEETP
ncbi:pilus assembly protein TadE [Plantactinospora sp. BC1]|uniref:TadE/TadG family type IV pilus assembly protein n=1 Tax=Plantactinospora sp. BC1 TaxID=2108470 RepID=UPI000D200529|nr:TadE/TadG family type IV pilus assembly protein [Plantactinospora sp. BC1]AVT34980.1 pilus assembly protein TadE [Plantactinospora sp. BC1]